jgi:hypothetical protein
MEAIFRESNRDAILAAIGKPTRSFHDIQPNLSHPGVQDAIARHNAGENVTSVQGGIFDGKFNPGPQNVIVGKKQVATTPAPVATAPAVAKTAQQSQATSGTPQSSFIKQNKLGVRKIARPGAKRGNRSALLSDEGSARLG